LEAFQTVEISKDGVGTGKYRKTRTNGEGTFELCDHEHDTREEADTCPDIQGVMGGNFPYGARKPDTIHIAARDLYNFLFKVVGDLDNPDVLATIKAEDVTVVGIRERLEKLGAALSG